MQPYTHKIELFSTRFQYADRRVLFGRARLFADRIELAGWNRDGSRRDVISFADIDRIEWAPEAATNAVLHLRDGQHVGLQLRNVFAWRKQLEGHLHWGLPHVAGAVTQPLNLSLTDLVAYAGSM